jgi:hypothetical protein
LPASHDDRRSSATDERLECVLGNEQLAAHLPEGEAVVSRPQDREFALGLERYLLHV